MTDRSLPGADVTLPPPPAGVSAPTLTWATGAQDRGDPERVADLVDQAFRLNPNRQIATSLAFVAVQGGRIVAERYGPSVSAATRLISWSTAKSVTHAAVGLAVADGLIDVDSTPAAPEWTGNDPRSEISLRHLLSMRSGLEFSEDYVDVGTSHCLEMLFGTGADDMAAYAASQPLAHPIDTVFNYSSGTTNIISRAVASVYGGRGDALAQTLTGRLFEPLGMSSADLRFDGSGTWVGSSYLYATARDFARFGELYLRDGVWDGARILPEGWVDDARTARSAEPDGDQWYGSQWWVWGDEHGTFAAQGYEGQLIAVVPALDLVLVRLGKTPIEHRAALFDWYRDLIDAFV